MHYTLMTITGLVTLLSLTALFNGEWTAIIPFIMSGGFTMNMIKDL